MGAVQASPTSLAPAANPSSALPPTKAQKIKKINKNKNKSTGFQRFLLTFSLLCIYQEHSLQRPN